MKVTINKSGVKGTVIVPSSKSMTIRALMCAALARGTSELVHPLVSDDTNAAADVLGRVGVKIEREKDLWRVTGGSFRVPTGELHCGESATTMRFMMGICSLIPGKHTLVGGPSLSGRPMRTLVEALGKLGVRGATAGKTTPPVTIEGGTFTGGYTEMPGHISSQFISALLLIAPFAAKEVSIKLTTPLTSKPYVLMTLSCLKKFGINVRTEVNRFVVRRQRYQPARVAIEGDWSSASYFAALGAFSEGITLQNVAAMSLQGDRVIMDFLRMMGAAVKVEGDTITVNKGRRGNLHALRRADLSDCIDLLPTMAVLAALAEGKSEFTGIERARIKESNRVAAIREGLEKLDVPVSEVGDHLNITGLMTPKKTEDGSDEKPAPAARVEEPARKEPVLIDSHADHRIAMAFGVMGAAMGGITIAGAECVTKTFPDFWEDLKSIGGDLRTNE